MTSLQPKPIEIVLTVNPRPFSNTLLPELQRSSDDIMFSSNPTKNLGNKALSGKGTEMAGKAKNLASEMGTQGLSGTGGTGMGSSGLGNAETAAAGVGGKALDSHHPGTGNLESSNPRAFNQDSSRNGYGGQNINTDSYGRDTGETFGRGNNNTGMNQGFTSGDRDQYRENFGQQGTGTNSSFGTGDLARGTGTGTQQHYGNTGDHSTLTSGGNTGIGHHPQAGQYGTGVGHHHQGAEGVHARQYTGRTSVSEGVSAPVTGVGYSQQQHASTHVGHHDDCDFCRKYSGAQTNTTSTSTAVPTSHTGQDNNRNLKSTTSGVPPSSFQQRTVNTASTPTNAATNVGTGSGFANQNNSSEYGETIMTTTTSSNTTEGPSPYHLRPGETIVEKETRVHRGIPAGSSSSRRTSGGTGMNQPSDGQFNQSQIGNQTQQRRKSSVGEKIMEKMSGKSSSKADAAEQGATRVARNVNPSRN